MPATAQIAVNSVPGSNDNVTLNASVALSNDNNTGVTTWEWAILSQPTEGPGAANTLSSTSVAAPTFTPTREGSYLIRLIVNKGLVDEASDIVVVAVRELETNNRVPAIMETTENSASTGWAGTAVNDILRRVTRLTDAGTFVAIADETLAPGNVVHMSGMVTIANGLPGERQVPTVQKALATSLENVDGPLGVMIGDKAGERLSVSTGEYCRVIVIGALSAFNMDPGGSAGDPIYISDTGTLSLTPGTFIRQVGDIARVISPGVYDLAIAAVANSIPRGNAGGDLSGEYPNPTVAKVNGTAVSTAGGALTANRVLRTTGSSTADWGTLNLGEDAAFINYLNAARGGTGNTATPPAGSIVYGDGLKQDYTAVGTSGYLLKSNGAGVPTWLQSVPPANGGTGLTAIPSAGVLIYGNGSTYSQLGAGTTDQILRGGSTPSWGTVPTAAFAASSIPYNAIQTGEYSVDYSGTLAVASNPAVTYVQIGTVTTTLKNGAAKLTIQPLVSGVPLHNRLNAAFKNYGYTAYYKVRVQSSSPALDQSYVYQWGLASPNFEPADLGPMVFPAVNIFLPSNATYTFTAYAAVVAPLTYATWYITDYKVSVWQG